MARLRRRQTKRTLSASLQVTERTIFNWEKGLIEPDQGQIEQLARVLDFPVEFFEKDEVSLLDKSQVSFRSLKSMKAKQRDSVVAACSIAAEINEWLDGAYNLPENDVPDYTGEDPEIAAAALRHKWRLGDKPIMNMVHLLEAKGVRVYSLSEKNKQVDACSAWLEGTPTVLLNTFKSSERSRFDSAHELAHLCLHRHGSATGQDAEYEADTFARFFLMPEAAIRAQAPKFIDLKALFRIKKVWRVSLAALAYHYGKLELLSEWRYRHIAIEISKRGYRTNEPYPCAREQSRLWGKLFKALREEGKGKGWLANELKLPASEISELLFGLTLSSIASEDLSLSLTRPRAQLKLIIDNDA